MAIYKGSRYAGVKFTAVKFLNGITKKFLHARKPLTTADIESSMKVIRVKDSDTVDILARKYGGDEHRWWVIADINEMVFPFEFENTEVFIPERREFRRADNL